MVEEQLGNKSLEAQLHLLTTLISRAGILFQEGHRFPTIVGSCTHLKGYGQLISISEELRPQQKLSVASHLLGHIVLGHTYES